MFLRQSLLFPKKKILIFWQLIFFFSIKNDIKTFLKYFINKISLKRVHYTVFYIFHNSSVKTFLI